MTTPPDATTVVWLTDGSPGEAASRALAAWAASRGVVLEPAIPEPRVTRGEAAIRADLDRDLQRAREAITNLDADGAERALARAEDALRDHPELPEGAWLRAEILRGWSTRFLRIEPRDEPRARRAAEEADALDGGRVAGIGEVTFPRTSPVAGRVRVVGVPTGATIAVWLDGAPLAPATNGPPETTEFVFEAGPGEHLLRVDAGAGEPFAGWIGVVGGRAEGRGSAPIVVEVPVAPPLACSAASFGVVRARGASVEAPGVTCPRWLAVRPGGREGALLVASCNGETCGALGEWRIEHTGVTKAAPGDERSHRWPAWATWTLVSVGAVAATAVILTAAGVFREPEVEPRFVAGGVRVE